VVLLEEFMKDPWTAYIKAERYVNGGSRSGLSQAYTTSERTQPRSSYPSFELSEVRFGKDVVLEDFGGKCSSYVKDGCMFVHPDMLEPPYFPINGSYSIEETITVAPTASGRTVLVLGKEYFVKLAYLSYLGRLVRHTSRELVLSACEVTKQLMVALHTNRLNPAFSILREDCGRVAHIPIAHFGHTAPVLPINESGCYEWGVLFRESRPFPPVEEREILVPFFALFSQEFSPTTGLPVSPQDKPLLIQLFEKQNRSIQDFLLNDILFPLFNTYFDALLFAGVELEAHSQNMLLTIDSRYAAKRIVCRDLESAGRDLPVMEHMGIDYMRHGSYKFNTILPRESGQKYPKYYINHSFMFDFKLGEYLVTPLIELANQYYPFDRDALIKMIKEFNRQFIDKLPSGFFPPDWCSYENINWDREGRAREYIWQDDPKYR
jgi:hypothetical protein